MGGKPGNKGLGMRIYVVKIDTYLHTQTQTHTITSKTCGSKDLSTELDFPSSPKVLRGPSFG